LIATNMLLALLLMVFITKTAINMESINKQQNLSGRMDMMPFLKLRIIGKTHMGSTKGVGFISEQRDKILVMKP
ncbi:MAG TPA: hypothetical protein P5309_09015, partial [Syntrophomonadaceae bacterium]|nr:hypothetical protein [Syntrophomonadaceae bacterium]